MNSPLFLTFFAILVVSATAQDDLGKTKSELLAAGVSQQAVDGLANIYTSAVANTDQNDKTAQFFGFLKFLGDVDSFMKTQSPADRAAYQAHLKKQEEAWKGVKQQ